MTAAGIPNAVAAVLAPLAGLRADEQPTLGSLLADPVNFLFNHFNFPFFEFRQLESCSSQILASSKISNQRPHRMYRLRQATVDETDNSVNFMVHQLQVFSAGTEARNVFNTCNNVQILSSLRHFYSEFFTFKYKLYQFIFIQLFMCNISY